MRLACLGVSLLCLATVGSGCATLSSVRAEKGGGESMVFSVPYEAVWEKTLQAVAEVGLSVAEINRKQGYVLAKTEVSLFSWGERVAIFVERIGEDRTQVEVVSRKVVTTNVFAFNWQPRVLNKLSELLSQARAVSAEPS